MTDDDIKRIQLNLPHPRDPQLGADEYYVKDTAGRIQRGRMYSIRPHANGRGGMETRYALCDRRGNDIHYWGDLSGFQYGFPKSEMYDNKEDCRNDTHACNNDWEKLRKLQEENQ